MEKVNNCKVPELVLYVNENPELSPPRGKLRLVASNGIIIEQGTGESAVKTG